MGGRWGTGSRGTGRAGKGRSELTPKISLYVLDQSIQKYVNILNIFYVFTHCILPGGDGKAL